MKKLDFDTMGAKLNMKVFEYADSVGASDLLITTDAHRWCGLTETGILP